MSETKMPPHIEGYVVNFLTKNYWRVQSTETREDCMQIAYVVFLRCKRRYPDVEDKHFMALFKTAWGHEFTDLSNENTALRKVYGNPQGDEVYSSDPTLDREVIGDLDNEGVLATMIRQAPREVLMVLNLLLNTPQELLDLAERSWKKRHRSQPFNSEHVAQLLSLPEGTDVMGKVEAYFRSQH